MKNKKTIIGLVAAILLVAAAVAAIIIFKDQIKEILSSVKEKAESCKKKFTPEECRDFADI